MPALSFGSWAFAFGPFSDAPWSFQRVCRWVADAGYDGIEINGFRPHPHDADLSTEAAVRPLRDLLGELGLGVSGYAPDFSSTDPSDSSARTAYLDRVDSALAFCRRLDAPFLRVDTVSPPGPFDARRFEDLAVTWRAAAERCADVGAMLIWEFEPGFWLNRPSQVIEVVQAVGHPAFSILFDTSHAYTGAVVGARQGSDPELLEGGVAGYAALLAPYVAHLHLIDTDGSLHNDETSSHLPFGTGSVDFDSAIDALSPVGLGLPWWTVDFCFCPTTEHDGRAAVPVVRDLMQRAALRAVPT